MLLVGSGQTTSRPYWFSKVPTCSQAFAGGRYNPGDLVGMVQREVVVPADQDVNLGVLELVAPKIAKPE